MDNQRNDQDGTTAKAPRGTDGSTLNPPASGSLGEDRPQRLGVVAGGHKAGSGKVWRLTAETLRANLSYNPETGAFTRLGRYKRLSARDGQPGRITHQGYREIHVRGEQISAHRLAWLYMTGEWPKGVIDHINGDRSDNRWCNLRDTTPSVNQQNRGNLPERNRTGFVGVTFHPDKNKHYQAVIHVNGARVNLGHHETPEEASRAYLAAKALWHKSER